MHLGPQVAPRGSYSFVDLWLCAERLYGDVAELRSLINYALAANELGSAELPSRLCTSPGEPSAPCAGSWGGAGLWKLLDVVNQATCFASHRLCGSGQFTMTCQMFAR